MLSHAFDTVQCLELTLILSFSDNIVETVDFWVVVWYFHNNEYVKSFGISGLRTVQMVIKLQKTKAEVFAV